MDAGVPGDESPGEAVTVDGEAVAMEGDTEVRMPASVHSDDSVAYYGARGPATRS